MSGRFVRLSLQTQFWVLMGFVALLGSIMAFLLWRSRLDDLAWFGVGTFLASLVGLLWFVQVQLIWPVRRISVYALQVSESDLADLRSADLRFTRGDQTSGNEIQRMNVALKRLLRSLKVQRENR